jgi:uncharacterized RDD family membrane protein YckC
MTSFREYRERLTDGRPPEVEEITLPREARPYQGLRAGIVTRVIANTIDFAVMLAVLVALYLSLAAFDFLLNTTSFTWPDISFGRMLLIGFGWLLLYFAIAWAWGGRTYGDYVMGLRVVNFRGDRMRPGGAVVRSAFCVVVPLGLFWILISRQNRSLQDVVLRTSVIYDWQVTGSKPVDPTAQNSDDPAPGTTSETTQ